MRRGTFAFSSFSAKGELREEATFRDMFGFFMSSESRSFHLDTIIAFVISVPRKGEDKLKWRETKSVDQQTIHWFSEEDVFQIKKQASSGEYPFTLFVKVMGGERCSVGPFHSVGSAKEAAERIQAGLDQGKVHYSQIRGSGHVAVASRVVFGDL